MKQFIHDNKTYNLINSWEDMNLKDYINFFKFQTENKDKEVVDDLYLIEMVEIMSDCDVIMDIPINIMKELMNEMNFLTTNPELKKNEIIEFKDKIYKCVDFNTITSGEYISIKVLMGDYKSIIEGLPSLLAVVLRPCEKVVDSDGKESYKIEKFDASKLQDRSQLFLDLKIVDILHWTNFFLITNVPTSKTTKSSMKGTKKMETDGLRKSQNNSIGSL